MSKYKTGDRVQIYNRGDYKYHQKFGNVTEYESDDKFTVLCDDGRRAPMRWNLVVPVDRFAGKS